MILQYHSDVSYLSVSKARLRAPGYVYLSSDPRHILAPGYKHKVSIQQGDKLEPIPPITGAVYILSTIIKNVMASATKAEIVTVFWNA